MLISYRREVAHPYIHFFYSFTYYSIKFKIMFLNILALIQSLYSFGKFSTLSLVATFKSFASFEFIIHDAKGNAVYSVKENKKPPVNFVWDGKDNSKILCADGSYTAQLT